MPSSWIENDRDTYSRLSNSCFFVYLKNEHIRKILWNLWTSFVLLIKTMYGNIRIKKVRRKRKEKFLLYISRRRNQTQHFSHFCLFFAMIYFSFSQFKHIHPHHGYVRSKRNEYTNTLYYN